MTIDPRRQKFDIAKMGNYYDKAGLLTSGEFETLFEETMEIRRLEIVGLDWLLSDHMLSAYRNVPLVEHYKALAAGLDAPFSGIEKLYQTLIDRQIVPAAILNQTRFFRPPTSPMPLGLMLHSLGLLSEHDVQRALGIKELIRLQTGQRIAVGQIFRSLANISVIDFFQALGIQTGVAFESLDGSAPEIFERVAQR
ncbi:MAG: hypothetical protein H6707_17085 [Deltaproteobacteria bacterium]|nr:hypothetical protein [Deltaproteobacteria bacterium]